MSDDLENGTVPVQHGTSDPDDELLLLNLYNTGEIRQIRERMQELDIDASSNCIQQLLPTDEGYIAICNATVTNHGKTVSYGGMGIATEKDLTFLAANEAIEHAAYDAYAGAFYLLQFMQGIANSPTSDSGKSPQPTVPTAPLVNTADIIQDLCTKPLDQLTCREAHAVIRALKKKNEKVDILQ
jgi:hypothetical protein